MATTTIALKRPCSRCPRVEEQEIGLDDAVKLQKTGLKGPKAFKAMLNGDLVVEHENLCGVCEEIVQNYLSHISKVLQHRSSLRTSDDDTPVVEVEVSEG